MNIHNLSLHTRVIINHVLDGDIFHKHITVTCSVTFPTTYKELYLQLNTNNTEIYPHIVVQWYYMVSFGLSSIYWVKYQNLGPYFTYFTKVIKIHNKGDIIFIIMMTLEMLIHFPCKVLIVSGDNNPQRQLKLLVLDKRVDLKVLPI